MALSVMGGGLKSGPVTGRPPSASGAASSEPSEAGGEQTGTVVTYFEGPSEIESANYVPIYRDAFGTLRNSHSAGRRGHGRGV
jgi:hypothetical protein